ncbi:hypothetical protein E2I14_10490 [Sapientia aquatica]|uniref:Uncharacterized protein n=1 Tax=Sapientia aquatica TaxID=1549640 RepID=A0A4R5W1P9_9BURK|nr:hypothetical protein E2I14_10490 [Sapientia aquatica]
MTLSDYGFVDKLGRRISLLDGYNEIYPDEGDMWSIIGKAEFGQRGDIFSVSEVKLKNRQIAAYAVTAGSETCVIGFNSDISRIRRIYLRLKIKLVRRYQ